MTLEKATILKSLQQEIRRLEGFKPTQQAAFDAGLSFLANSFPDKSFPLGAVHEFMPATPGSLAATKGFVTGILGSLLKTSGAAVWISTSTDTFPPALSLFGIPPDQLVFIQVPDEKHLLWTTEEALKCGAVTAVIAEIGDLGFTASRRLQLAVEKSLATGFVLLRKNKTEHSSACVSRWRITSLLSEPEGDLPGIGYPHWKVELLKIRNGKPGSWEVQWKDEKFSPVLNTPTIKEEHTIRKAV